MDATRSIRLVMKELPLNKYLKITANLFKFRINRDKQRKNNELITKMDLLQRIYWVIQIIRQTHKNQNKNTQFATTKVEKLKKKLKY